MQSPLPVTSPTQLPDLFIQVKYPEVDIRKLEEKTGLTLGNLYIFQTGNYRILAVEVLP